MPELTDDEYEKLLNEFVERIRRDFPTDTVVQVTDENGRKWPVPVSAILWLNEHRHERQ